MPITLGPIHISGHRGSWLTKHQDNRIVKALTGQPKDSAYPSDQPALKPKPRRTSKLPWLSIERTTPETRYSNSRTLAKAIRDGSVLVKTPEELIWMVEEYLRIQFEKRAARPEAQRLPAIVLVGDLHDSNASLMLQLAVTAAAGRHGAATVLLELDESEVRVVKRHAETVSGAYSSDVLTFAKENRRVGDALIPGADKAGRSLEAGALVTMLSAQVGAVVGHMDVIREGSRTPCVRYDEDDRELSMVQEIWRCGLQHAQGPVVVMTGSHHLPALHKEYEQLYDVISLSFVDERLAKSNVSDKRKRCSALQANDDVFRVRADPLLDSDPFNPERFCRWLGVDLRLPLRGPISRRSSGE